MRWENLRLQELKKNKNKVKHDNPYTEFVSYNSIALMSRLRSHDKTRSTQCYRRTENRRLSTSAGVEYADMCFGLEIIKMWHFYERQPTKFSDWHFDDRNESASCAVRSAAKAISLPSLLHELGFIRGVFKSYLTLYKPMTGCIYPNRYIVYSSRNQMRVTRTSGFSRFGVTFGKRNNVIWSHLRLTKFISMSHLRQNIQ